MASLATDVAHHRAIVDVRRMLTGCHRRTDIMTFAAVDCTAPNRVRSRTGVAIGGRTSVGDVVVATGLFEDYVDAAVDMLSAVCAVDADANGGGVLMALFATDRLGFDMAYVTVRTIVGRPDIGIGRVALAGRVTVAIEATEGISSKGWVMLDQVRTEVTITVADIGRAIDHIDGLILNVLRVITYCGVV